MSFVPVCFRFLFLWLVVLLLLVVCCTSCLLSLFFFFGVHYLTEWSSNCNLLKKKKKRNYRDTWNDTRINLRLAFFTVCKAICDGALRAGLRRDALPSFVYASVLSHGFSVLLRQELVFFFFPSLTGFLSPSCCLLIGVSVSVCSWVFPKETILRTAPFRVPLITLSFSLFFFLIETASRGTCFPLSLLFFFFCRESHWPSLYTLRSIWSTAQCRNYALNLPSIHRLKKKKESFCYLLFVCSLQTSYSVFAFRFFFFRLFTKKKTFKKKKNKKIKKKETRKIKH